MFRSDVHSYLYLVMENVGHLHVNIESNSETDGYQTKTKSACYFFPRLWETVCYRKKMVMRKFAINQEKQNIFTLTPKHIKHDYVKTWNILLKGFFPNWFSWVSNLYYIMFFKIDRSLPPGPAQLLLVLNVRQLTRWKGQGNSQGQGQELCPRPHAESPGGNLLPAAPKSQSPALLSQHQSPSGQQLDLAALGNDHGCCHQQNPDAAAATLAAKRLPPHGAVQRVPLVVEGCVF